MFSDLRELLNLSKSGADKHVCSIVYEQLAEHGPKIAVRYNNNVEGE